MRMSGEEVGFCTTKPLKTLPPKEKAVVLLPDHTDQNTGEEVDFCTANQWKQDCLYGLINHVHKDQESTVSETV